MDKKKSIYDSHAGKSLALSGLLQIFNEHGVRRVIYKVLSPNDNSKNQPYMAGHLTELGFLPTGSISETQTRSLKTNDPKRKVKFTAILNFYWISYDGQKYAAPNAKLIYYPQYPEVRLSGFLAGTDFDMGGWMDPAKYGRMEGRTLLFGITDSGEIYAWLALPDSHISRELINLKAIALTGVFREIPLQNTIKSENPRVELLAELKRIYLKGWIPSKRLEGDGRIKEYSAPNGGGYTLEAELGVIPNGFAEPDFLGWEVKQFHVEKFHLINSKPLTVMTPEPDGGYYVERGVEAFIRRYGYADTKGRDNRYNFNGIHKFGVFTEKTGLTLITVGYDSETSVISDAAGYIALVSDNDEIALSWSFTKIMDHWKRKHAKAVYVPSISNIVNTQKLYHYGKNVRLFEGTNMTLLLRALNKGNIYYDPGIKMENSHSRPVTKRRSQFRIKSELLANLYHKYDQIDVMDTC